MANPMRNEDKLYQILQEENAKIHPIIWQLLDHHIRNDLYSISMITCDSFDRKEPLTEREINKVTTHIKNITSLLKKLQEATHWDGKYYQNIEKGIE